MTERHTAPDLNELYQSVILDHNRAPRNFRELDTATGQAEGNNPLCGDRFRVWVRLDGDRIADVTFLGAGCAISTASASIMTTTLTGKTMDEARALFEQFHSTVTGGTAGQEKRVPSKFAVFQGVAAFPMRVKCATLAWHAVREAIGRWEGPPIDGPTSSPNKRLSTE